MSVKTKQAPAGTSSIVNGIGSPPDSLQVFQSFKTAITTLTSHAGFATLSHLADQIPQLENTIRNKDGQINELEARLETERKDHVADQDKELRKFGRTYTKLGDEKTALQTTIDGLKGSLQDRDTEIATLRKDLEDVKAKGRELQGKFTAKTAKLKEKDLEIADLKKQLEATRLCADESAKKLNESRDRVVVLESLLEKAGEENGSLQTRFNDQERDLQELRGFGAILYDVDFGTLAQELENLWNFATSVVGRFLRQELPDDMLQNDWAGLRGDTVFGLRIPLPQSNSEAAKEMRIAMVVGILARLIDQCIFQPTYVLEDGVEIREVLRLQAGINEEKEAFARAMLLSMFPEEHEVWERQAREWVVEKLIGNVVVHFLPSKDIAPFREELEQVVEQAQECWRVVQYCKRRLEPSFRYTHDPDFGWQTFEFQTANAREETPPISPITADDPEDELFVIFPRVYIVKDKQPVTPGAVLRRTQVRAAVQEARENASQTPFTEPTSARHRPRRNREMSGSGEGMPAGSITKRFLRKATWMY